MKTIFKNAYNRITGLPALLPGLFLCALAAAFVFASTPQITPAIHWHADVTTVGASVKWFGHTGVGCTAALLFFMPKTKHGLVDVLASFLGTVLVAGAIASVLYSRFQLTSGKAFVIAFLGLVLIGAASFVQNRASQRNVVTNDILKQIWINKIMEYFLPEGSFIMRSEDQSAMVNYNVINLAEAGVDPDVLIDNAAYPIEVEERTDNPLEIPLKRLRTKNTIVRDAIAVQLAYNQLESVIRGHRRSLQRTVIQLAAFGWAPQAQTANIPVIPTTGKNIGSAVVATSIGNANLLAFTLGDLAACQKAADDALWPAEGRIFVMSTQHRADLVAADALLFKQFSNIEKGKVLNIFGFDIYFSQANPLYDNTAGTKNGYGSVPNGNSAPASFFYHESEMMRAMGTTDMFYRLRDPEQDGDIVGFSQRFVALPYRSKYNGAIYSMHV